MSARIQMTYRFWRALGATLLAGCAGEPPPDEVAVGIGVQPSAQFEILVSGDAPIHFNVTVATVEAEASETCAASTSLRLTGPSVSANFLLPKSMAARAGAIATGLGDRNVVSWDTPGDYRYLVLDRLDVAARSPTSVRLSATGSLMCRANSSQALLDVIVADACESVGDVTLTLSQSSPLPAALCGAAVRLSSITDIAGTPLCFARTSYVCSAGPPTVGDEVDSD